MTRKTHNHAPELSLKAFFKLYASEIFGIEGRLYNTLKALIFYPGKLTKAYVRGASDKYISPPSLYFSINLFFFLLLPLINSGKLRFLSFSFSGFTTGEGFFQSLINADLSTSNLSPVVYQALFDAHITYNQPALIFIIIPVFALLLKIVEIRGKRFYVEHLVFAFHFMSFFLIIFFLSATLQSLLVWLSNTVINIAFFLLFITIILVYIFQAVRKNYQREKINSLWKTIILSIGFVIIFIGYISFLFFHALFSIG